MAAKLRRRMPKHPDPATEELIVNAPAIAALCAANDSTPFRRWDTPMTRYIATLENRREQSILKLAWIDSWTDAAQLTPQDRRWALQKPGKLSHYLLPHLVRLEAETRPEDMMAMCHKLITNPTTRRKGIHAFLQGLLPARESWETICKINHRVTAAIADAVLKWSLNYGRARDGGPMGYAGRVYVPYSLAKSWRLTNQQIIDHAPSFVGHGWWHEASEWAIHHVLKNQEPSAAALKALITAVDDPQFRIRRRADKRRMITNYAVDYCARLEKAK